jgi:oligopeptide transport system substrate-binding protein
MFRRDRNPSTPTLYHSITPFLLLLFAALICACGPRETRVQHGNREQILHVGNGTEPAELDPHIVTGVPENKLITALLEGLVAPDPKTLDAAPGVAERWDISQDQLTYTFHLNRNAKWSNGDPVTAQDFVGSFKRMLMPSLAAEYAYMLFPMRNAEEFNTGKITNFDEVGVKALDPHTLQITLSNPTPYFLSLITHYSWFPVHLPTLQKNGAVYERGNQWTRPKNFVGNGPFTLSEWRLNSYIRVKKSPTYWDADTVRLKEIYFYPTDNQDAEERSFRSGQLHITYELPRPKIERYKRDHPELLRISPYLGTYFYIANVTKPPLDNPKVRRALSLAIERESIVRNVTKGGELPAFHFTPPDTGGYTARTRIETDVEVAKRLLAEAGHPDGQGIPRVEILFNTHDVHRSVAEAIQQMWKKHLNINAQLVNQEWKVVLDAQKQRNFQLTRYGWIGDYADPTSFLDLWVTGGGNNRSGWSNPEYDRLIREAGRTPEREKRFELFQQAEAILLQELPVLPIYFYTRVYLLRPNVKGWHANILDDHPYKHVWLE